MGDAIFFWADPVKGTKVIWPKTFAFTGLKRSGKDTCADYLVENYGFQKYALASPMKEIAKIIFGWEDKDMQGDKKEYVWDKYGFSPREFLQLFGTELMQHKMCELSPKFKEAVGRNIWVSRFIDLYYKETHKEKPQNLVISDLRFPHEQAYINKCITKSPAVYIRVERDTDVPPDTHSSEASVAVIDTNYTVTNNGSIDSLYMQLDRIMLAEGVKGSRVIEYEESTN